MGICLEMCLLNPEEDFIFPGVGVPDCCEPSKMNVGNLAQVLFKGNSHSMESSAWSHQSTHSILLEGW